MSQEEIYGTRGREYSAFHRRFSIARYVGIEQAQRLAMIDLDAALYVEYDDRSREPLALIETARDVGQDHKPATVTRNLARRSRIPAYVLLYRLSHRMNPADPRFRDCDQFRLKRLWPHQERQWRILTPEQWCRGLMDVRAWQARRVDAEMLQAANDPLYHDQPPVTVASGAERR